MSAARAVRAGRAQSAAAAAAAWAAAPLPAPPPAPPSALVAAAWLTGASLRQALRARLVGLALLVAGLLVGLALVGAQGALHEGGRIAVDLGLAACSVTAQALAVGFGVAQGGAALRGPPAEAVLARPLPRWAALAGAAAGLWLALALVIGIVGAAGAAATWAVAGALPAAFGPALLLCLAEAAVAVAVAHLGAVVAAPPLAAGAAVAVLVAGHLAEELTRLLPRLHGAGRLALGLALHVLPDLGRLSARPQAANDLPVAPGYVAAAAAYAAAYALGALALAAWALQRRRAP